MTEITPYAIGDWVVHHAYGIGQIKKIEEKTLHGESLECFRVKSKGNTSWWFPRSEVDNPRIRPIASLKVLKRAQNELQKTIRSLEPDRNMWRQRIDEVRAGDDLIATSQLVRDLTILKSQRKLNQTESKALDHFTDRLLREWSATLNTDIETIRPKLNQDLQACSERAEIQP